MKKSLFQSKGKFYKANLHNHSTYSDGQNSVDEIKQIYQAHGYQIVAYTDHDVMINNSRLTDDHFLALTALEYEYNDKNYKVSSYDFVKTYHFCLYAPRADETYYPQANPSYAHIGNAKTYIQNYVTGSAEHAFSFDLANALIEDAHAHGFLIAYNHPQWSINTFRDYEGLGQFDFMECANSGCFTEGFVNDFTDSVFREFLALGHRCFPTCTDDGHNNAHYCKAWTMIKADRLDYDSVFASMKRGDLYASWGPEINEIAYDPKEGTIEISTSPVRYIGLVSERRFARLAGDGKELIDGAEFDIKKYMKNTKKYATEPEKCFVRFVVIDQEGNRALSRAYFYDELKQL